MGGLWKKKRHIKTSSQNATTLREAGYWFIPEALIRKTGSQHKVFPSLYSNEAEFALWCAALILEATEGVGWVGGVKNEIFRSNWPRQWCITETGRLSLKGCCSITAQALRGAGQGEHEEMERHSAGGGSPAAASLGRGGGTIGDGFLPDSLARHHPTISRPGRFVAQWSPHVRTSCISFRFHRRDLHKT